MIIGNVVSVLTNPYTEIDIEKIPDASDQIVTIQSDSDFIPPFMVVIEVAKIPGKESEKYDAESGQLLIKGFSCKCIYFNSVTKTYEEKWFPEKFLKQYEIPESLSQDFITEEGFASEINTYLGQKVILKTWKLESAKLKSYLKVDSKSLDSSNHVTMALLKHLPPLMTVIGFVKPKEGNNKGFDKTTGDSHKKYSNNLLKCQWYNPKTGNFSENVLPIEILSLIPEVDTSALAAVKHSIQNKNQYFKIERGGTIFYALPLRIVYNHCEHLLIYEDLISGKTYSIQLESIVRNLTPFDLPFEYAPKLEDATERKDGEDIFYINSMKERLIHNIEAFFDEDNFYYKLKYIDSHQRVTSRTISKIQIYQDGDKKYLKAHCHLRGEERTFLMDNVLQVRKLFPIA